MTTSTPVQRAWTDIEPKLIAWLSAGGLLTVATIVYGYVFPSEPLPVWIAPVVTLIGGAVVAYFNKSTVPVAVTEGDHVADSDDPTAGFTDAPTDAPTVPDASTTTQTTNPL